MFLQMNGLRLDVGRIEGYYPKNKVIEGKVEFQVYILRRNISEIFITSFTNEQARNDCLSHLDSVLKPTT